MQAMDISLSGMDVEWRRIEVIANNIANVSTARTAGGDSFRAMRLLSGPRAGFKSYLNGDHALKSDTSPALLGVTVYGEEPVDTPVRRVYEPGNPQADAKGFVTYPGIDQAQEMTLMVKTARAYESNVVAMNIARQMYSKALELGK